MSKEQPSPSGKKQPLGLVKRVILPVTLCLIFIALLLIAGIAWRQLDTSTMAELHSSVVQIKTIAQLPNPSAEIAEQLRESTGIILATVVIVLIILGGTFGATRRKDL